MYVILYEELTFVRERIKTYYDKNRVEGLPLKEGDKVYLLKRYIRTKRLSNKLDFKKLGLFKIEKKISTFNYILKLLNTMRLRTRNFYISLLELVLKNVKIETELEVEDEE